MSGLFLGVVRLKRFMTNVLKIILILRDQNLDTFVDQKFIIHLVQSQQKNHQQVIQMLLLDYQMIIQELQLIMVLVTIHSTKIPKFRYFLDP